MELRHTPYFEYGEGDQEFHPYVDWTIKQKDEVYKEIRVFVDKVFLHILWIDYEVNLSHVQKISEMKILLDQN